jgi:hypothetical protein
MTRSKNFGFATGWQNAYRFGGIAHLYVTLFFEIINPAVGTTTGFD